MICPYFKSWNLEVLRNRLPSCFLFRGMVRNGMPRVCFSVCSTERSPSCFLFFGIVRNGIPRVGFFFFYGTEFRAFFSSAEWFGTEFRELILFLFHCTEFRGFFSSAKRFGTEFREFPNLWNSRNSAGTNQLFHNILSSAENFFVGNCQPYL
jgi:hypothetical protein